MGKINWNINGKSFESFGINVAACRGLGDDLKQKERQSYNWPGRNGKQYNLNSAPKYEERVIELDCYIVGDNWDVMVNKFNSFSSEFAKVGTQRFIVEIFSFKARVYDILLYDKTVLSEVKQEGQSFGAFTIKFIEPEPIKKILYTESTTLQLSFNTPSSVIINIDGKAQQAKGDVSINTNLPKRAVSGGTKNLALWSYVETYQAVINDSVDIPANKSGKSKQLQVLGDNNYLRFHGLKEIGIYTISGWIKRTNGSEWPIKYYDGDIERGQVLANENWQYFERTFEVSQITPIYDFVQLKTGNQWVNIALFEIQIEKGDKASTYHAPTDEQHYISIAGNIDEITNLNTNAQILWEKL